MSAASSRHGIFVTATDTGVGKTFVAAALSKVLTSRGLAPGVMKPVETGVENPKQLGPDARLLCEATGITSAPELISPYRFKLPAAPDMAAHAEGSTIHPSEILAAEERLAEDFTFMIIEGAGGLMVPLRGGYLIADLAMELNYPLLVVTRPDLGTINHTLLTVHTARSLGLEVAGMIINRMPETPDKVQASAPHALASLASTDMLAVLPEVKGNPLQQIDQLADALESSPTLSWLLNALGVDS